MKQTKYLYNINPSELENKYYLEALKYKHEKALGLFRDLFFKHNRTKEEDERLFHVRKAEEHCRKLIDELNENV